MSQALSEQHPPDPKTQEKAQSLPGIAVKSLLRVFTDPFRGDPEQFIAQTPTQRIFTRRVAVLRLILISIVLLSILVVIPAAIMFHAPFAFLMGLTINVALCLFSLLLVAFHRPTLAGILYIVSAILLAVGFVFSDSGASNEIILLILAALVPLILTAGIVLPSWTIWPTAIVTILATALCTAFSASIVAPANNTSSRDVRITTAAILIAIQALTAVITYVSARSAGASEIAASRAFERERELTALKDQFIIDANHELRTPIMALYGNIELISLLGNSATSEQRSQFVQRALRSGDSVLRLLTSVLDTSALESGAPQLEIRPLRLAPIVHAILETFDPREIGEPGLEDRSYESRPVSVEISADLALLADEGRLRQVLINLLSNALKYSDPGTPIIISARTLAPPRTSFLRRGRRGTDEGVTALPPRLAQISIRDSGLGVPQRDAPKLFNRFVRLERDIAGPVRGTGVGLYLCRVLVEAMGGRIWVESSGVPGDGSTFAFTLPTPQPSALTMDTRQPISSTSAP